MKLTLIGAALAAASLAQAGAGDYLGAEPRQLGRRLANDEAGEVNETDPVVGHHHLEGRSAAIQAKAKAHAAAAKLAKANSKSAAAAKAKSSSLAAAAAKSKSAALSRSKSLASKSKSLASKSASLVSLSKSLSIKAASATNKASSLASKSASVSKAAAASASSAASVSSSLAAQQSRAAASASSLSSVASVNSAAAESIASAQKSLSAAQASITQSASRLSESIAAATAAAGEDASSLKDAQSALASARQSLSADAATLTAQAKQVSASSVAVDKSASALSDKSVALDKASSSLSKEIDDNEVSFGQVSSALSSQSIALAKATAAYADVVASISTVQAQQASAAAALAASSVSIASATSSLAAQATASGLATACLLPRFLGNGHCYDTCPDQFPVQFTRDDTFGLCCSEGAQECIAADPKSITVCAQNYYHTVLDEATQSGTCTTTCCTVEDGVAYQFKQLGGVYDQCVKAQDCVNGAASADPDSGLCCDDNIASCKDQTVTGALTCAKDLYFTANPKATDKTGSCSATCADGTFYAPGDSNECLAECPVKTAYYTPFLLGANGGSKYACCEDEFAATCTWAFLSMGSASTSCVDGYVLDGAKCVAKGACSLGRADNGKACCPDGALACDADLNPTSCGLNNAGKQTFLGPTKACVLQAGCPNGASVLDGGRGVCCSDKGSLTCASAVAGNSLTCDADASYYLAPSSASTTIGTCVKYCAGSFFDKTTQQCVTKCASGSSFVDPDTKQATCCAIGQASCDATGAPLTCSKAAGYFLQPDGKSCLKICPAKSVKASSGGLCCASGTSDCTDVALHGAAVECTSAFYMLDKTCVATCPTNTIPNTDSSGDKICSCIGKNFDTCNYDGTVKACDAGFSASGDKSACVASAN